MFSVAARGFAARCNRKEIRGGGFAAPAPPPSISCYGRKTEDGGHTLSSFVLRRSTPGKQFTSKGKIMQSHATGATHMPTATPTRIRLRIICEAPPPATHAGQPAEFGLQDKQQALAPGIA